MQDYLNDSNHAYDYAKTLDFKAIMETASGADLTEFFDDWLFNQGYPSYLIEWNQPTSDQVTLRVNQTQSDPSVSYFEAPVPLRLIGTMGEELDVILDNTVDQEEFMRSVSFTIQSVLFDPEADLISRNNNVSLSINIPSPQQELVFFPNPASETLTILKPERLEVSEIRVFNNLGQLILKTNWSNRLNVSKWSSGLFFVQLQTNQGIINKSLLKN